MFGIFVIRPRDAGWFSVVGVRQRKLTIKFFMFAPCISSIKALFIVPQ
jgi:hypothetical protein